PPRRRRHQHDGQRRFRRRGLLRRHRRGVTPGRVAMAVWRWLGRVPFAATVREQEALREQVLRGEAPETLLLCEHDPVVTLGRSANPANVLAPRDELARRGVEVYAASRGGDVTYHGPGQLVGYPIVRL